MSAPTATSLTKRAAAPLFYSLGVYSEHLSSLITCQFMNPKEA